MSGSVNKAIIVGNLGGDPDVRSTQDGRKIATFSVATSETWRDKATGERKERTQWHRVVVFNEGLAKIAEQYLKKGHKVYVEGQMESREWTDQGNQKRATHEIVLRGFNSVLTMLQSQAGNRPPPNDDIDGGRERHFPAGEPSGGDGLRRVVTGDGRTRTLDDEIPF